MKNAKSVRKRLLLSLLGSAAALAIAAPAANASLSWPAGSHDFGNQQVGSPPKIQGFALSAVCDSVFMNAVCLVPAGGVHPFTVTVSGDGFTLDPPGSCLAGVLVAPLFGPATCASVVTFDPKTAGPKTGTLAAGSAVVQLSGTALAPPAPAKKKKCKKKKKGKSAAAAKKCKKKK